MNFLKDIKVLDLSTVLAGPSVASFLGELGAKVHKFESPHNGGDVTRSWRIPGEQAQHNVSAYFASINYCKTYSQLDLMRIADRERLMVELVDTDVLITNFKEGDDKKFGLVATELKKQFPRLIQAQLRGFDSDPQRVAYDVVLQAECGLMGLNGAVDGAPTKFPIAIVDVLAAHQMKEAILLALYRREKTGAGSIVSSSLEKAGMASLVNQASNYMMTGLEPQRMGSQHPNIAPYGDLFPCQQNKWIVLAVGSDRQFVDLCKILGREGLAHDPRFQKNPERVQHREELIAELSALFLPLRADEFIEKLHRAHVPAGLIRSIAEVTQIADTLGMIHREKIGTADTARMKTVGFTCSE
jgi:crotonobetainyl-CoA:carnitine CoA-transferase CaiB-like acyl-CoA transferase